MSTAHESFPIKMNGTWQQPATFPLGEGLKNWLLDPSSLTARLQSHCQKFRVELLGQHTELCSIEDANEDIPVGEPVLVREVLLWCDGTAQVFARSLLPLTSLTGEQRTLANLGDNSLGQVLFNHKSIQRKAIEIADLSKDASIQSLHQLLNISLQTLIFARRSTFLIEGKPVVVAEAFLSGAFAYQEI